MKSLKDFGNFGVVTLQVKHVGSENKARTFFCKAYIPETDTFQPINELLWKEMNFKLDNKRGGIIVPGGGMNMAFALKLQIEKYLKDEYSIESELYYRGFTPKESDIRESFESDFIIGRYPEVVELKEKCKNTQKNDSTISSFLNENQEISKTQALK